MPKILSCTTETIYFTEMGEESEGPMLDSSNTGSKPKKLYKQRCHVPINPSTVLTMHSDMEVVVGSVCLSTEYH